MAESVYDHIRRRKARRQKRKLYLFGSLAVVIAVAALYFVFFSGIFSIRAIEVSGTEAVSGDDVRAVAAAAELGSSLFLFSHANLFLFPSAVAENNVRAAFPRIVSVSVRKNIIRRTITVAVSERQPAGVACVNNDTQCAYFDESGMLFAAAPTITSAALVRIEEQALDMTRFPEQKYAPELIAFVTDIKKRIMEKIGATVTSFTFMNGYGDVEVRTQEGYSIFLSTEQSADRQAQILKNIFDAEIKDQVPHLEYVDLRVENRAYYKLK